MATKELIIESIKAIIAEYGSFTTADVEATSSPVINSMSKDCHELGERFDMNGVNTIIYVHETESGGGFVNYEELDENTLEEILLLAQDWESSELKTQKRIKD